MMEGQLVYGRHMDRVGLWAVGHVYKPPHERFVVKIFGESQGLHRCGVGDG